MTGSATSNREPTADDKLRALREETAASSNAGTVSTIATTGHVASIGIFAAIRPAKHFSAVTPPQAPAE